MANFRVNVNAMRWSYYDPATVCADLLPFQVSPIRISEVQTTLAEPYTAGQGYMVLTEGRPFWGSATATGQLISGPSYSGQAKPASGPIFQFAWRITSGSNKLFITSISSGTDTDCPAGAYVDNKRANWTNSQGAKAPDPIIIDGIDTGWPAGLSTGQSFQLVTGSGSWKPVGNYTLVAVGTGTVAVVCPGSTYKVISFVDGVPTGSNTFAYDASANTNWTITVTASSPANPLRIRHIIVPGTLDDGVTTYVQDYATHSGDPGYRRWYRPYQAMYEAFDFGLLRDVNTQPINTATTRTTTDLPAVEDGQHKAGMATEDGPSVEDFLRFPLSMGKDAWFAILERWSDTAVANFGHRANAVTPDGRKVYVEYINEIWNPGYGQKAYAAMRWALGLVECSVVRSGGTATVTKPGHGFSTGNTVIVTGALQSEYNGEFTVTKVDNDTFTYPVSGSPASPASTTDDGRVVAYKSDSLAKPITSITANLTSEGLSYTVTFASDPVYTNDDFVILSGLADPKANGVYRVKSKANSTTYTLYHVYGVVRPLPDHPVATSDLSAASGQTIRSRLLAAHTSRSESIAAGIPSFDEGAARWSGRRHAQIHAILSPILGSKLVRVVGGWSNSQTWNDTILDQYKQDNGGTYPAGTKLSIAPYFYATSSGANKADESTLVSLLAGGTSQADCLDLLFRSLNEYVATDTRVATIKAALPAGVGLIAYELGQHLAASNSQRDNTALVNLYVAANRDARMKGVYDAYFPKLGSDGLEEGNHYSFISSFDKYGCWGLYEYMGQADTPKATSLKAFMTGDQPARPYAIFRRAGGFVVLQAS